MCGHDDYSFLGLLKDVLAYFHEKLMREKFRPDEKTIVLNVPDLTRCGIYFSLGLKYPMEYAEKYKMDVVFKRILFSRGIIRLIEMYAQKLGNVEVNKVYTYEFKPNFQTEVNGEDIEKVRIEAYVDAYFRRPREILMIRYVGKLDSEETELPKKHHIEQAALYQWLALANGDEVDRVRILYHTGFGKIVREYIVETKLSRNIMFREEFRNRILKRIETILGPKKRPLYGWECDICQFKRICQRSVKLGEGIIPVSELRLTNLINEGEYRCYVDPTLKVTMLVLREAIENEIEISMKRARKRDFEYIVAPITKIIDCPLKFWFNVYIPYASVTAHLKEPVLRGNIVHYGAQYIIRKLNGFPELARKYNISYVEVEKTVKKPYIVAKDFSVIVKGRCDIIIEFACEDGTHIDIIELKTTKGRDVKSALEKHEQQLKMYLGILKDIIRKEEVRSVKGKLVYIHQEGRAKLTEKIFPIDEPLSEKDILRYLEEIRTVREEPEKAPIPRNSRECDICDFFGICPYSRRQRT